MGVFSKTSEDTAGAQLNVNVCALVLYVMLFGKWGHFSQFFEGKFHLDLNRFMVGG